MHGNKRERRSSGKSVGNFEVEYVIASREDSEVRICFNLFVLRNLSYCKGLLY